MRTNGFGRNLHAPDGEEEEIGKTRRKEIEGMESQKRHGRPPRHALHLQGIEPKSGACSPGWLTHWFEAIANTSVKPFLETFQDIMTYRNNSGSVNFYMAHGGTNFGYWSGDAAFPIDDSFHDPVR